MRGEMIEGEEGEGGGREKEGEKREKESTDNKVWETGLFSFERREREREFMQSQSIFFSSSIEACFTVGSKGIVK